MMSCFGSYEKQSELQAAAELISLSVGRSPPPQTKLVVLSTMFSLLLHASLQRGFKLTTLCSFVPPLKENVHESTTFFIQKSKTVNVLRRILSLDISSNMF